jgi:pyoverdine/dityrosine biosynthesis protein Dit1
MVGKIKLIYTPHVIDYLDDLVRVLYKKEYFGFIETAEDYVSNIYDAIPERIKLSKHQKTPKSLKYKGSNYIFYKANARTTWYIFFEKQDDNFLITGILNNHCEEAGEL